ncbi:MAG: hypothetical protein IKE22_03645 [Atopobiaceae bacterium]|nr:hypothetical protein [Atopobiaceae bacterium]
MAGIIIYGSQYGTTKQYAEELSRRTGYELRCYDAVDDLNGYDTIVYLGALYAGGVLGMKKTFAKLMDTQSKNVMIATVGLADPTDQENTSHIKGEMRKQLPKDLFDRAHIFHLRGGIDYSQLGLKHKTMMALLYLKAKNLPEKEKTAEVRAMIETYNDQVSFIDFDSLDQILAAL